MRKVIKWIAIAVPTAFLALFMHYTLPQYDIVQVVDTENRRIDFGENSWFWASRDVGTELRRDRDVFFIQTKLPNGKSMVYRNEDTGWDWPPYFKFDSSNLQTDAAAEVSTGDTAKWVKITHYGWRVEWFSIFPNAISVTPVAGPDVVIVPWVSIAVVIMMLVIAGVAWRSVRQFKRRFLQPHLDAINEGADALGEAGDAVAERARQSIFSISRWLDTWKGKPRT